MRASRWFTKEWNHQEIGHVLIVPENPVADHKAPIRWRYRLGGVLKYYYRDAA